MRQLVLLVAVMSTANAATVSQREAYVSCEAVAAKIVSFMAQDDPVQTPARITTLLTHHCHVDRWSYAARACIASSESDDDADRCVKLLTPEQIASFRDAVDALR